MKFLKTSHLKVAPTRLKIRYNIAARRKNSSILPRPENGLEDLLENVELAPAIKKKVGTSKSNETD